MEVAVRMRRTAVIGNPVEILKGSESGAVPAAVNPDKGICRAWATVVKTGRRTDVG